MRVLYIEDNLNDAAITGRMLARIAPEIKLTTATSLAEGMRYLEQSDRFDALLIDLNLTDGCGLEMLDRVRAHKLPLAVVIVTGSDDHDKVVAAYKANADGYVIKEEDYLERLPQVLHNAFMRFRTGSPRRDSLLLRVLYVEHDSFDLDLMRRHLAKHAPHINLTIATNALDALALLPHDSEQTADFDIVLVDYNLPGMDGLEFVRQLREERKLHIPIVMITGQGNEMVAARALHLGVEDYLPKREGYLFEIPATLEKAQW